MPGGEGRLGSRAGTAVYMGIITEKIVYHQEVDEMESKEVSGR